MRSETRANDQIVAQGVEREIASCQGRVYFAVFMFMSRARSLCVRPNFPHFSEDFPHFLEDFPHFLDIPPKSAKNLQKVWEILLI